MPLLLCMTVKKGVSDRFLEVYFAAAKDAHPQIYDFFLEHAGSVLKQAGQGKSEVTILRLEPLNVMYSHLDVSPKIMQHIFDRFCKTHRLKMFAGFDPKQKFSCRGNLEVNQLPRVFSDYNLLFDLFFCDVRIKTKGFFIDAMDLFSNRLLVQGAEKDLKRFQKSLKKTMPKTTFFWV